MFICALARGTVLHSAPEAFVGAELVALQALSAFEIDTETAAQLACRPLYTISGGYLLNHTGIPLPAPALDTGKITVSVRVSPIARMEMELVPINTPLVYGDNLNTAFLALAGSIQKVLDTGVPPIIGGHLNLLTMLSPYLRRFEYDQHHPAIGVALIANLGDEAWHSDNLVDKFALMSVDGIDATGWTVVDHAPVTADGVTFLNGSVLQTGTGFKTVPVTTFDPLVYKK